MISVPEYYARFINPDVDLESTPKQCCPFHQENTPSFSYDSRTGRWRCFGACHTGGDVVMLHKINYRLSSIKEARESLCKLTGHPVTAIHHSKSVAPKAIEQTKKDLAILKANKYAESIEDWLKLDSLVTSGDFSIEEVEDLYDEFKRNKMERVTKKLS